jgi:hypothetical protein
MVAEGMKKVIAVLYVLLAFLLICNPVSGYSESIQVPARGTETRTVDMNKGDQISGRVSIVGHPLNFSISGPDGQVILNNTLTNPMDFQFTAPTTGSYNLHFENLFSDEMKFVTLNYNVQHYIFGVPQEYMILFFIVGIALVALVVYVAMSPRP